MILALHALPEADLHELATAIRSGRLSPPFHTPSLQGLCSPGHESAVASELQRLLAEGMKPAHVALLLDAVAAARPRQAEAVDPIDLVWTGPEAAGVANRDTSVVVRELFSSAKESVLVVGFAVYQGREVFQALAERMDQSHGLKVRMFLDIQRRYKDTTKDSELLRAFVHKFKSQDWPGPHLPEVFYDPRSLELDAVKRSSLHAKCIVIDRKTAFVTSANFTEAAQVRNLEVGALLHSARFAGQLADHFDALAAAKLLLPVQGLGEAK